MADRRKQDISWNVADEKGDLWVNVKEGVFLAVLMDIRDELHGVRRTMRRLLTCKQLGEHLDRTVEKLKAPKCKAKIQ